MPVAKVSDKGVELAYLDSGVPAGTVDYTTIVIIHGYCWSGDIFQKVIAAAPSFGIRVITLNRRDYTGSSPFTPEEMAPLQSDECSADTIKSFLYDRAEEYANFLKYIIHVGGVTKPSGKQGGIVLMAWSLGNVFGLNFLENARALPAPLAEVVTSYIRSYILLDPPFEAVALPPPSPKHTVWSLKILEKYIDPADPNNPENLARGIAAINDWLSGWFRYDVISEDPVKCFVEPNDHPIRESTRQKEEGNIEFTKCNNAGASVNENTIMKGIYLGVFDSTARSLLLSKDGTEKLWPGMEFKYIRGENSCWTCAYAAEMTRKKFEDDDLAWKVEVMRGANHFIQWENPVKFIEAILPLIA